MIFKMDLGMWWASMIPHEDPFLELSFPLLFLTRTWSTSKEKS
jgi:hypothetical protein